MRIPYICYADLKSMHGNPVHVVEVSCGLQRLGHDVEIVVPSFGLPDAAVGVPVVSLRCRVRGAVGCVLFGALSGLYVLRKALADELDVVYAMQMSLSAAACVALTGPSPGSRAASVEQRAISFSGSSLR